MSIRAAIHHLTHYKYDRPVSLSPQIIRLRPAPHSRTRVISHSLKVSPAGHFVNFQQDPYGNWLARYVFPELVTELRIEVGGPEPTGLDLLLERLDEPGELLPLELQGLDGVDLLDHELAHPGQLLLELGLGLEIPGHAAPSHPLRLRNGPRLRSSAHRRAAATEQASRSSLEAGLLEGGVESSPTEEAA